MIFTTKHIFSRSNLAFLDQAFVSGMNFLTGLALARFLGLEGYGQYVLVYGVILFFSTLQISLIVSPMMVRGAAIEESLKERYFSVVTIQQFLFSVLSAVVLIIAGLIAGSMFGFHEFERLLVPLALATAVFLMQDYYRRYFFVVKKPVFAFINDILSYGIQFTLVVFFGISKNIDTAYALWFMVFAFLLAAFVAFIQSGRKMTSGFSDRSYFVEVLRESYHFGKWLLGANTMYWGQAQVVNYFVVGAISVATVGALNACKNVLGILNIFFLGLQNILLPDASRSYKDNGIKGLRRYLGQVAVLGGIITIAVALVAGIWNEYWMRLLYGSVYRGYGWIVIWWGVYFVISFFHRPYSAGLSVLDRTRRIFHSMIVGFGLFVVLGYFFTIHWQVNGVMFLMCLSNLVTLLLLRMGFTKEHEIVQRVSLS